MLRASIDLGTNTCLLLIVNWDSESSRVTQILGDFATIVRLGEGVDQNRNLSPRAMMRALNCLKIYSEKVKDVGLSPQSVVCVATSQARDAQNSSEFFSEVQKETGFQFKVISGQEEAQFTFVGALLPQMEVLNSCVIDIGGGSTELMTIDDAKSIDLGSVRFTERFLKSDPVTDEEFWKCQNVIDEAIQRFIPWRKNLSKDICLIAVAGTATTLAAWHLGLNTFDPAQVDSTILTCGDLHRMVEELKWRTIKERAQLPSLESKRADVILAGALILWRAMEILQFPKCWVSTRGLRFGILGRAI